MKWSALAAIVSVLATSLPARAEESLPPELEGIAIEERPGAALPLQIALTDQDGRSAALGDYLAGGKPAVLVLAYFRCPMLCSLVINGLTDGLRKLPWSAGQDFRVLVVSFDPRDTPQLARAKRLNYLKDYGRPVPAGGFEFLTGAPADVRRLADSLGFHYRWDEKQQQYVHAAGAFVVTPGGRLSQTLYGITFPTKDLRLALAQASQGRLGSAWDRVVLFCFHYDSSARGYVLAARRLMQAGGALSVVLLGLLVWRLSKASRRQEASAA